MCRAVWGYRNWRRADGPWSAARNPAGGHPEHNSSAIINVIEDEQWLDDKYVRQNYFDTTDKDDMVSFLQSNKVPSDWDADDDPSLPYTLPGRNEVKIGKIIKLNKERELKERLFKQTVEQLKQTFEKTDLDKLQNLYFDFDVEDELDTDLETEIDLEDEQDGQEPTITELVQQ